MDKAKFKEERKMMVFEDALGFWSSGKISRDEAADMLGVCADLPAVDGAAR